MATIAIQNLQGITSLPGRTTDTFSLEHFQIPEARSVHGESFPLGLKPSQPSNDLTIEEVGKQIKDLSEKGVFRELLNKRKVPIIHTSVWVHELCSVSPARSADTFTDGAILFRGLPIKNAEDFSKFVNSAQSEYFPHPHKEVGLSGKRTTVTNNVKTANEEPPNVKFYFHNEYGRSAYFPDILYFCSEKVPEQGGQTPILSSLELYDTLKVELPQFIEDLTNKGNIITTYMGHGTVLMR